jgi:hypothetical protein
MILRVSLIWFSVLLLRAHWSAAALALPEFDMRQVIPAEGSVGVAVFVEVIKPSFASLRVGMCPGSTHHMTKCAMRMWENHSSLRDRSRDERCSRHSAPAPRAFPKRSCSRSRSCPAQGDQGRWHCLLRSLSRQTKPGERSATAFTVVDRPHEGLSRLACGSIFHSAMLSSARCIGVRPLLWQRFWPVRSSYHARSAL